MARLAEKIGFVGGEQFQYLVQFRLLVRLVDQAVVITETVELARLQPFPQAVAHEGFFLVRQKNAEPVQQHALEQAEFLVVGNCDAIVTGHAAVSCFS